MSLCQDGILLCSGRRVAVASIHGATILVVEVIKTIGKVPHAFFIALLVSIVTATDVHIELLSRKLSVDCKFVCLAKLERT